MNYLELAQEIFNSGGDTSPISSQDKNLWYQEILALQALNNQNPAGFSQVIASFNFDNEPNEYKKLAYKTAQLFGAEEFIDKLFLK